MRTEPDQGHDSILIAAHVAAEPAAQADRGELIFITFVVPDPIAEHRGPALGWPGRFVNQSAAQADAIRRALAAEADR
jgi:hypothetical protein